MQKPTRKNSHKERIFSLPSNKIDFEYQKEHQEKSQKPESSGKRVKTGTALTSSQVRVSLKKLTGWHLSGDSKIIYRELIIQDFMAAIDLINRIAEIAEDEKHHPNIHLTDYRKLRIELTTHDLGGISKSDFVVAAKINDLPVELKR
ncbi:MAG: 4a-hydroxytetrahydrobiopterin dehydratase [Candidatus Omnitrophica bacterium]|nr:4a-hydroxytetrahydrobiopterin dehydratase [Candidatus Omnitrophota bacterium]